MIMTAYTYAGWGERGSRFLTDLLRYMNNAGMIRVNPAENGQYYIETANGDLLRVGYSDTDDQVIGEVEALVEGNLLEHLGRRRAIEPAGGAGMDRREGRRILKNSEDVAAFIRDLLNVEIHDMPVIKLYISAYGGSGSGFADTVLEWIENDEVLTSTNTDQSSVVLDVTFPERKRDNTPVRKENGKLIYRYEDMLEQVAEFEAAETCGTISALSPSDNGLALIAEMAHRGALTLDQLRSIVGPVLTDEFDWSAVADYLETQVDLPGDSRVGHLNTAALRAEVNSAMLRFDDSVTLREPQGGLRDPEDMRNITKYTTAVVDAYASVNRGQAAQDETHLGKSYKDAAIAATKRAANMPLAAFSPQDVRLVQLYVATADDTPLAHLDAARNAVARELGNGDFQIFPSAIENVRPEHFVDGARKDAAVWLRIGTNSVLEPYQSLSDQL